MPLLQAELLARLTAALPPSTSNIGSLVLLNDVRSSFSFTSSNVNASTGVITIAGHNFTDTGSGTRVQFPSSSPGGLTLNLDYWVRNVSGSSFQLSATPGGSPIGSFSSPGSGTMTISDQPLTATDQSLSSPGANNAQWLRKEVGTRLYLTTPAATSYTIDTTVSPIRAKVSLAVLIDNSSGSATLTATKLLLLFGGNTTAYDTTGTPERWWDVTLSVAAGTSITYILVAFDSN